MFSLLKSRITLVVILICLLYGFLPTYGQTKIGDLTIKDKMAEKYLIYCYNHPDTMWVYYPLMTIYEHTAYMKKAESNNIGKVYGESDDYGYVVGYLHRRKPTGSDYIKWFNEVYLKKGKNSI